MSNAEPGYGNGFAIGEFTGQWSANRRIPVRALKSQIMLSLSRPTQKENDRILANTCSRQA